MNKKNFTLEVIAKNLEDVQEINKSTADRIELCSNMDKGGYTQDYEVIKEAIKVSNKPIMVMIRNQESFVYNESSFADLINQVQVIKKLKPAGFVFGFINSHKEIDLDKTKKFLKYTKGFKTTFHKAFDEVEDKIKALSILNELKIDNVLTGYKNYQELLINTKHTKILFGGGVRINDIKTLLENKIRDIHVGRAVRETLSWESKISIGKIDEVSKK